MRPVLVLLVVALLPMAQAGSGDAGTGSDASGSEATATLIQGDGTYSGNLARNDADWFTTPESAAQPICAEADVLPTVASVSTLAVGSGRATVDHAGGESGRFALAGVATATHIGIVNGAATMQSGPYGFSLTTLRATQVTQDSGTTGDAPDQFSGAASVAPGCVGGALGGLASLDAADTFHFVADASSIVFITLASTAPSDMRLDLSRADGTVLGTIIPGQSLEMSIPESGAYYLTTSSVSVNPTQYALGLVVGPPGQGCRPACLST